MLAAASAVRSGEGVTIDLKTSSQTEFRLDRFTMGDWIFVWSPDLYAPAEEQPLDCDLSQASGLVKQISLSQDGKRKGVRIYLGEQADTRDVFLVPLQDGLRVVVPPARPLVADAVKLIKQPGNKSSNDAQSVQVADFSAGAGTLDYQLNQVLPAQPPPGDADDDGMQETTPEKESAQQPDPVAPENRPDRGRTQRTPAKPRTDSGGQRIATSSGLADGMVPEAQLSFGGAPFMAADSKEALRSVRIELFEIVDEPLDQAIQLLVAPTEFNIIVDSSVGENSVSLSFKDGQTDLKSALDLLSRTYALEYIVEAGTIVVASKDKVFGNLLPFETRLFVLSYADPQSVRDILITTGIVADTQIEFYGGETEYPTVNGSTALSDAGAALDSDILPIETNLSSSPRNAVLVHGPPDLLTYVAQVIGQLDRKPMQIQLEVRVCEANDAAIKNLGVRIDQTISTLFQEVGTPSGDDDSFPFTRFDAGQIGSFNRTGGLNIEASLQAQQEQGNVKVLSQPVITTTDGKQAIWFAGESVPYIAEPAVSTGSNFQAPKVKFIQIGVTLSFKPRLDHDGLITIDANPAISSLVEFLDLGGGATAPRVQNRQSHSTVRVRDGETFSLAGLITENERQRTIKVPLIGDLPLIGSLFREKRTERERTEIIVLVTPKILE